MAASHTWPSSHSPSPRRAYVREPRPSSLAARDAPTAKERPWPQGAGVHLHSGGHRVRVALELAADAAEGRQPLPREVSAPGQHRVQARAGVALAEDETVSAGPSGVVGVMPHDQEVQGCQYLHLGEGAARMPAACSVDHVDDVPPHPLDDAGQLIQALHTPRRRKNLGGYFGRGLLLPLLQPCGGQGTPPFPVRWCGQIITTGGVACLPARRPSDSCRRPGVGRPRSWFLGRGESPQPGDIGLIMVPR